MAFLITLAAVALAAVALVGRGPARGRPASAPSATVPSTTATGVRTTITTTTTTVPRPAGPAAVGETALTVARDGRRFPVVVLYPATRPGTGAPPARDRRPYPLIVFSPGFDIDPTVYTSLLASWTTAGYVVAEPYYPFTAAGAPGGVNEEDLVQHPADLRAVVDRMLTATTDPGGPLTGMVDPSRIGVAGHSDGGDVTDAVVADSCCLDPRVRAAAVLSGAELAGFGGTYGPPAVPLLVVQGDDDDINPPACSEQIYNGARAPRYYLDLRGAGHLPPYSSAPGGAVYQEPVRRVTLLFWQAYLKGDGPAAAALAAVSPTPAATLTSGGPVGVAGTCPGAP